MQTGVQQNEDIQICTRQLDMVSLANQDLSRQGQVALFLICPSPVMADPEGSQPGRQDLKCIISQ